MTYEWIVVQSVETSIYLYQLHFLFPYKAPHMLDCAVERHSNVQQYYNLDGSYDDSTDIL